MPADTQILASLLDARTGSWPCRMSNGPLLDLVSFHRLAGWLVTHWSPQVPLPEALRSLARSQEAHTRFQLEIAAELGRAFAERRVPVVFVKGVAMALTAYGSPGLRPFGDLDVLTAPTDLPAAREVLRSAGFEPEGGSSPNPMEENFGRRGRPGPPVFVDLHWTFTGRLGFQAPVRIPAEEIVKRARPAGGVPVPSFEDDVLLASANLIRSGAERLILVADFAELARRPVDWDQVVERAVAWRLRTSTWTGLRMAGDLFGRTAPTEILERLAPPSWRARWIRRLSDRQRLVAPRRLGDPRYRFLLKALCLDSWRDVARTGAALPERLWRLLARA